MIVVRAVECDINRSSSICSSVNRDLAVEGAIFGVCLAFETSAASSICDTFTLVNSL